MFLVGLGRFTLTDTASAKHGGPIITIDGPAGSGKSTTARLVSERLGYLYLDTGAMYRAFTLAVIRSGYEQKDEARIIALLDETRLGMEVSGGDMNVFLNDEDVSGEIRTPEIDQDVTWVCQIPEVRERLVGWQREIAGKGGIIAEGRDMGTVVFPDADLKFYLVADPESRAHRRWKELRQRGVIKSLSSVLNEIMERDTTDSTRSLSPMVKPADAIEIDTSDLTIEQQVGSIVSRIREKIRQ